jgi:hypothetical protein
MRRILITALAMMVSVLVGCGALKRLVNIWTVQVENQVVLNSKQISGVTIKANGEQKFTLDYGQSKSFDVDVGIYKSGSVITVSASHPTWSSDAQFILIVRGETGSTAHLLLTTRKILDTDFPQILCTNCSALTSPSAPPGDSGNPVF